MDHSLFLLPPPRDAFKLIGFGSASDFEAHFPRHGLDIAYTIDRKRKRVGERIHGVEVREPEALRGEDPAQCLILVYEYAWFEALRDLRAQGAFRAMRARGEYGIHDGTRYAASLAGSASVPHRFRPARRGFVVQGPLHAGITATVLRCYALMHPDAAIVLSTWKGEDEIELRRLRPLVDSIVLSDPPAQAGDQNRNYQVRSTLAGLDEAKRLGLRRVAKVRTDSLLMSPDVLDRCDSALDEWPVADAFRGTLRSRIVVLGDASWRFVPYHYSDQVLVGDVNDLIHYWSCGFQSEPIPAVPHEESMYELSRTGYVPECYFAASFLRRSGKATPTTVEHSWEALRDAFVVLDGSTMGWLWWKVLAFIEDAPYEVDPELLRATHTHASWRALLDDESWRERARVIDRDPPLVGAFWEASSRAPMAERGAPVIDPIDKPVALSGIAIRERIPLMMPALPSADELLPYLRRIDANRWYSNFGPLVSEFEARIAASFAGGEPCHVVSVSSCTAGIELALRTLALPPGAPILVPALTFIATASAVRCAGLSPVVADIDPASWLLTPDIARAAVRTIGARAVVPVTTFGVDQDGAAWSAFARDTGVPVIVDAAAGFGNQRDPGPTCAVFSLHATKPLAAGEGGFVVTRDAGIAHAIRRLSNFGINLDRPHEGPIGTAVATGTNAKLSEYHAAVALASLDRWPSIAAERGALYTRALQAAQAACGGRLVQQAAPAGTVRSVCAYRFPHPDERDRAEAHCKARGIGTRRWYLPTIDRQPAFGHVAHLPTPVADHLGERLLGVPFYPGLAPAAIDEIAAALGAAFSS